MISIKLQSNFIEISLWHGCSPVHLLNIFRTPFPKNTSNTVPKLDPVIFSRNTFKRLETNDLTSRFYHLYLVLHQLAFLDKLHG